MREIKFRAWIINQHSNVIGGNNIFQSKEEMIYDFFKWKKPDFEEYRLDSCDDIFIMQFTGLEDKNGVEIYEGDIIQLQIINYLNKEELYNAEIIWSEDTTGFYIKSLCDGWCDDWDFSDSWRMKVIGNIYQNPELLK